MKTEATASRIAITTAYTIQISEVWRSAIWTTERFTWINKWIREISPSSPKIRGFTGQTEKLRHRKGWESWESWEGV
jgi:hypothetical protein